MMRRELTLAELLQKAEELPWKYSIYAPRGADLSESTHVVILDPNEEEWDEEADEPLYARERGLRYILSVQDAQMVVENLSQQAPRHTPGDRLRAFLFYRQNDAYIDLSAGRA